MTKILLSLHLYNLELLNEFLNRINQFIKRNQQHEIHLIISIPISNNIDKFIRFNNQAIATHIQNNPEYRTKVPIIHYMMNENSQENQLNQQNQQNQQHPYDPYFSKMKKKILERSAWLNANLITRKNCSYLLTLIEYIYRHCYISRSRIHYYFMENRGQDIGGFMTMLKYLKERGEAYDYYIKMHTKTHTGWRREMLRILDVPLEKYVGKYDCVYSKQYNFPYEVTISEPCFGGLMRLFKYFEIPPKSFHYPAGTFFIVNHRFMQIFLNKNIDYLYSWMNPNKPPHGTIEYCYERFFGYLMDFYRMRKLLIS